MSGSEVGKDGGSPGWKEKWEGARPGDSNASELKSTEGKVELEQLEEAGSNESDIESESGSSLGAVSDSDMWDEPDDRGRKAARSKNMARKRRDSTSEEGRQTQKREVERLQKRGRRKTRNVSEEEAPGSEIEGDGARQERRGRRYNLRSRGSEKMASRLEASEDVDSREQDALMRAARNRLDVSSRDLEQELMEEHQRHQSKMTELDRGTGKRTNGGKNARAERKMQKFEAEAQVKRQEMQKRRQEMQKEEQEMKREEQEMKREEQEMRRRKEERRQELQMMDQDMRLMEREEREKQERINQLRDSRREQEECERVEREMARKREETAITQHEEWERKESQEWGKNTESQALQMELESLDREKELRVAKLRALQDREREQKYGPVNMAWPSREGVEVGCQTDDSNSGEEVRRQSKKQGRLNKRKGLRRGHKDSDTAEQSQPPPLRRDKRLKGKRQFEAKFGSLSGKTKGKDTLYGREAKSGQAVEKQSKKQKNRVQIGSKKSQLASETETSSESESESDFRPKSSPKRASVSKKKKAIEVESETESSDSSGSDSDTLSESEGKRNKVSKKAKKSTSAVKRLRESKGSSDDETKASSGVKSNKKKPSKGKKSRGRKKNKPALTSTDESTSADDTVKKRGSMKPPKFNGKGSFKDFAAQFDACRDYNGWSDREAAFQMFSCCQDEALATLNVNDINPREARYAKVVKVLKREFGPRECPENYFLSLSRREQKQGESLRELGKQIKRLVELAHPKSEKAEKDYIAREHFKRAITDTELRKELFRSTPKTLVDAIGLAENVESFCKTEQTRVVGSRLAIVE
ncbi:uncharacterized protein [Amphiura filiformis]|uniref:uncharacterized protein n=1 Tax=Amphiura filiformis TaxID=82378 RepID=UPI003B2211BE